MGKTREIDNMEKNKAGGVGLLSSLWLFDHAADE